MESSVEIICGKSLWGTVCGSYVLPSDEVVGLELEQAANHLRAGLNAYAVHSPDEFTKWTKEVKLSLGEQEFVRQLSLLLGLSAAHSWQIFQLFLLHEFRGADASLTSLLTEKRDRERFLTRLWTFYRDDRLLVLRCLRHVLANASNPEHTYQLLFRDFVRSMLDEDSSLGNGLMDQLEGLVSMRTLKPGLESQENVMLYHLAEMREVLACLLVYHGSGDRRPLPKNMVRLVNMLKDRELSNGGETRGKLRHRMLTEALEATHALLLIFWIISNYDDSKHDNQWVSIDESMSKLGSLPAEFPVLLAWAVTQLGGESRSGSPSRQPGRPYDKWAQRAVVGGAFPYLRKILNNEIIKGECLFIRLASSVVYSLICATSTCVDLSCLEHWEDVCAVANICLAYDPPAQLFWAEEGGGAGLLLPSALFCFPYQASHLLTLCTALATSNPESNVKVNELLSELPSITWPLSLDTYQCCVHSFPNGTCRTLGPISLLPGVTIPGGTGGEVTGSHNSPLTVRWEIRLNGWQVVFGVLKLLDQQLSDGACLPDVYVMSAALSSIKLLTATIHCSPEQLAVVSQCVDQSLHLIHRMSQMITPPPPLVAAILELLTVVASKEPTLVWAQLEGCRLLPFMGSADYAAGLTKRDIADPILGYQANCLRALVCGKEATDGIYPILKSYVSLVIEAVKGGVSGGSVMGGIVFLVREVSGELLRWCYSTQEERTAVLRCCLTLLHHSLDAKWIDDILHECIISQIVDKSSCGGTLLYVISNGAHLEQVVSQPSQAAGSDASNQLFHTARMALSILNRLVNEPNIGDRLVPLLIAPPLRAPPLEGALHRPPPTHSHLALTVSMYIHQRLNPRLTYLALRILTRFAQTLDQPLIACLASEADSIRDSLLRRLDSATEDIYVKVALLQLLSASTRGQQGLTRAFLSPPDRLLDALVTLLEVPVNGNASKTIRKLVAATVELMEALWSEKYVTATEYLKGKEGFWPSLFGVLGEPGPEVSDAIGGHVMRILALELFSRREDATNGANQKGSLREEMARFCHPRDGSLILWSKRVSTSLAHGNSQESVLLWQAWRDLVVVLVKRNAKLLQPNQKVNLTLDLGNSLLELLQSGSTNELQLQRMQLLADLMLLVARYCGSDIFKTGGDVFSILGELLTNLKTNLLEIPASCQLPILATALTLVSEASKPSPAEVSIGLRFVNEDLVIPLLAPSAHLAQCHALLSPSSGNATSPACLCVSVSLLRLCLTMCRPEMSYLHVSYVPVVPAVINAAQMYAKTGPLDIISELLSLLSAICRHPKLGVQVNTLTLATSLDLSQDCIQRPDLLSQLVWTVIWSFRREGVEGVEGAVGIAVVYLPHFLAALRSPHLHTLVAQVAVSLVEALAPYAPQWMLGHADSFREMVAGVARCLPTLTYLLRAPRIVEMDICDGKKEHKVENDDSFVISQSTGDVMEQMMHLLRTCLCTLRALSPPLPELVCAPSLDMYAWTPLFQPSFNSVSAHDTQDNSEPSLAAITAVLELYDTYVVKELRVGTSPSRHSRSMPVTLCQELLNECAEQAVLLLLSQAALLILSPETEVRDTNRVRHGLADEMNPFVNRCLGRLRPPPSPMAKGVVRAGSLVDGNYLTLCQQLMQSIASAK